MDPDDALGELVEAASSPFCWLTDAEDDDAATGLGDCVLDVD